jgi:hypothetical protein
VNELGVRKSIKLLPCDQCDNTDALPRVDPDDQHAILINWLKVSSCCSIAEGIK